MGGRTETLSGGLAPLLRERVPGALGVEGLRRLSGGASQETWAFDAPTEGAPLPLVLRRGVGGAAKEPSGPGVSLETEASLIALAAAAGVPVPGVRFVLQPEDELGSGFVMDRIEGETIARKILRDPEFEGVRPKLARQCGEIVARIHAIPRDDLPALHRSPAPEQLRQYRDLFDGYDHPHPVFEVAFRWLEDHLPEEGELSLVHGDFRNGNLIVGADGVRAVLDWEIAHLGDPMEDLGWIQVNSWRFGEIDKPVGGFGSREELFAGYEAGGGTAVDAERVHFWEVMGTLKWGIMCMSMYQIFKSGLDPSVERAAIGRRSSETELDLVNLLYPEV